MKKITLKYLESIGACSEAVEAFRQYQPGTDLIAVLDKAMKLNRFDWANWLIVRVMNKRRKVQYAVFAAELVIKIYEDRHPGDGQPRKAIDAAKAYLKNPCARTKKNARSAAYAAYAAAGADADAYAADAAYAGAAAAYAADAAYAGAAAYAAVYAADAAGGDRKSIQKQIINYGIKLLTGENHD